MQMPLDSGFKTPLITSERFWPRLVSISLFEAHLGSKTNRFSLSPHWSFAVTADTRQEILMELIKKYIYISEIGDKWRKKSRANCSLRQARAHVALAWRNADVIECFPRLPSRRSRVEKAHERECFTEMIEPLKGRGKKKNPQTNKTKICYSVILSGMKAALINPVLQKIASETLNPEHMCSDCKHKRVHKSPRRTAKGGAN